MTESNAIDREKASQFKIRQTLISALAPQQETMVDANANKSDRIIEHKLSGESQASGDQSGSGFFERFKRRMSTFIDSARGVNSSR